MNAQAQTVRLGLSRPACLGVILAAVILACDQLSKAWITDVVMAESGPITITPFFNVVLAWNRGISFGLLNTNDSGTAWVLPTVVTAVIVFLLIWLARTPRPLVAISVGLVLGGAIGNLVDRLRIGAVVDFLDFHVMGYHWPAFNLADSAITVGALMLVADSLFSGAKQHKRAGDQEKGP